MIHSIPFVPTAEMHRECLRRSQFVYELIRSLEFDLNYEKKERWQAINSTLDTDDATEERVTKGLEYPYPCV